MYNVYGRAPGGVQSETGPMTVSGAQRLSTSAGNRDEVHLPACRVWIRVFESVPGPGLRALSQFDCPSTAHDRRDRRGPKEQTNAQIAQAPSILHPPRCAHGAAPASNRRLPGVNAGL